MSDDLRMTSGVSTMSKELVLGTIDKYDWVQLGSGINHPEIGLMVDIDEDVRKRTGITDASLKIYPSNGFGNFNILKDLIKIEKPDAILHFTDPHYWQWLYENEYEIRRQLPLLYYHVWDNIPDPLYNRNYYESCDWIGCISKLTYGMVNRVGKLNDKSTYKPLEDWQISYVPHGINAEVYKPLDSINDDVYNFVNGNKKYDFILYYNNRNIRRKQSSDVILSYKLFCDRLSKEKAEKCLLLMHTHPIDENGTNLPVVVDTLCYDYDVMFDNRILEQNIINEFYNLADCTINIANNEGFGLGTAESIMAGTPIIVNVTGGLQDQCGFEYSPNDYIKIGSLHDRKNLKDTPKHGEWVVPVWPSAINVNGSIPTPYIFEDRVNNHEVADAIMKIYNWTKEERKTKGKEGREWAKKNLSNKIMCDSLTDGIENTINNFKPKERFNLYKII